MDRSVIRLSHCQKEIFCFSVPDECPSCGEELKGSRLQEAPVSLPSPFTNGHKTSCCLLVAPAHDNISRDFDGTSDLHTGISNTTGVVYNYTRGGVRREQSGWERCVSVPMVRPDMFHLLAQWDQYLDRFSDGPMWDPAWHRYTSHLTQVQRGGPQLLQFLSSVREQRPGSRGAELPEQRDLHSQLHPAEDEEGLQIQHAVRAHPETPVLHGGQTGGHTCSQLNQCQ
ncbi:MKRN2 opposite strand protein-like isoform X1 [Labrus mixtus]|uniref:MKRN2 opposite strand protein-like isoform X1 n=1 Tax=Labrus mixtus TaxID=508554 RepID=UPI0029BFF215|nr:MKRN2 opposite strand protein-like isoform X1 [Labrus mixtus]